MSASPVDGCLRRGRTAPHRELPPRAHCWRRRRRDRAPCSISGNWTAIARRWRRRRRNRGQSARRRRHRPRAARPGVAPPARWSGRRGSASRGSKAGASSPQLAGRGRRPSRPRQRGRRRLVRETAGVCVAGASGSPSPVIERSAPPSSRSTWSSPPITGRAGDLLCSRPSCRRRPRLHGADTSSPAPPATPKRGAYASAKASAVRRGPAVSGRSRGGLPRVGADRPMTRLGGTLGADL